jgi:hypothetical protein
MIWPAGPPVEFSDRNGYETSVSDNKNGTHSTICYVPDSSDPNYSGIAYFANSASGSVTVTVAFSTADPYSALSVEAWKGAATSSVYRHDRELHDSLLDGRWPQHHSFLAGKRRLQSDHIQPADADGQSDCCWECLQLLGHLRWSGKCCELHRLSNGYMEPGQRLRYP